MIATPARATSRASRSAGVVVLSDGGNVLSKVKLADLVSSIQVRVLVEGDRWVTFVPTLGPYGEPMVNGPGKIAMWAYAENRKCMNLLTGELDDGDLDKTIQVTFPLSWEPVDE